MADEVADPAAAAEPAPARVGKRPCPDLTKKREPCRGVPLAGGGGRCQKHANLPPTERQKDAARGQALRHGFYAKKVIPVADLRFYRDMLKATADPVGIRRESVSLAATRLKRLVNHEAATGEHTGLATSMHKVLSHEISQLPPAQDETGPELDREEVARVAEDLSRDPEFFLARLDPRVAEEIRVILRREGVLDAA